MNIKVRYLTDVKTIQPQEKGDWYDLAVPEDISLEAWEYGEIELGVAIELPEGYEAYVIPRSSTFKRYGLLQSNSIGLIDNTYCGNDDEWKFPVIAMKDCFIPKGTRIAQFRIQKSMNKLNIIEVDNLENENRNGFGSTGV